MAGEISQLIRAKSHTANMYIDTYQLFVNLVEGANKTKFNAGKQRNNFTLISYLVKSNYLNVSYKRTNKYLARKVGSKGEGLYLIFPVIVIVLSAMFIL